MGNATETSPGHETAEPHPFSTELHPEWCDRGVGCGTHISAYAEATGVAQPGNEDWPPIVVAAAVMDGDDGRWVDLTAQTSAVDVDVRLTPTDALNFGLAIAAKAMLAMAPCRMETRDLDAWLREIGVKP